MTLTTSHHNKEHSFRSFPVSHLGEISEVAGQSEVKFCRVIVSDDPGEDRVLVEVIIGTAWWKERSQEKRKWKRLTRKKNLLFWCDQHLTQLDLFLPEVALRNIRYSKFDISLRCQRWVMLDALNSCFGVAREIRLQRRKIRNEIICSNCFWWEL